MRPQSQLTKDIVSWIESSQGWFAYWKIDADLHIENKKDKTLRRVVVKRMVASGKLAKAPKVNGVYRKMPKRINL